MKVDFTREKYKELLKTLLNDGFSFIDIYRFHRLEEHRLRREEDGENDRVIILRQDVDRLPGNSLVVARIQYEMGVKSTFYFRSVPQSFEPKIVEEIVGMGHEVGYHYEDLSLAAKRRTDANWHSANINEHRTNNTKQLFEAALYSFARNLEKLRKYANVRTICMHGSPMSRLDSRLLWKYYDYKEFGILLEPYFDIDFEDMLYLTDTGRRWNGSNFSVRDKGLMNRRALRAQREADLFKDWIRKPVLGSLMNLTEKSMEFQGRYNFRSTNYIIQAAERGELPKRMMMTFHPQRWANRKVPWFKELVWQNVKNVGKYFLIRLRD